VFLAPKDFVASPEQLERKWPIEESLAYTQWLATRHYENFHVVSFLLPKRLHQDFYNVYAFCRWADDLGDEIGDTAESLRLLTWWRAELHAMYAHPHLQPHPSGWGKSIPGNSGGNSGGNSSPDPSPLDSPAHPVFVALQQTVDRHQLPIQPFDDLITAFEQDQRVARYKNFEELFAYCRYSANPVGRLVLGLCGYRDADRQQLSDATCTALQLANFWQDVTVDWAKDRVYLPLDVLARHGSSVDAIASRRFDDNFRAAMKEAVGVARELFLKGLPLADQVDRRLAIDLDLFSRGGIKVLEKIERLDYNVLAARPAISKVERVGLLLGAIRRHAFSRAA
jgi:squalene synthase HpnC